jgi:hypothetical protein
MVEKLGIAAWRGWYLQALKTFWSQGKNIIYVDETCVHSTHTLTSWWQFEEEVGATSSVSEGPRLIIAHAESDLGFVTNALLICKSHTKVGITMVKWILVIFLDGYDINYCQICLLIL